MRIQITAPRLPVVKRQNNEGSPPPQHGDHYILPKAAFVIGSAALGGLLGRAAGNAGGIAGGALSAIGGTVTGAIIVGPAGNGKGAEGLLYPITGAGLGFAAGAALGAVGGPTVGCVAGAITSGLAALTLVH